MLNKEYTVHDKNSENKNKDIVCLEIEKNLKCGKKNITLTLKRNKHHHKDKNNQLKEDNISNQKKNE
jgi:hypothetical protein